MTARAAQTSYISQKVAGSSGRNVSTPRQSMICPCTDIRRRRPRRAHRPGGPSKPLALPAAARAIKEEARPRAGGEDPAPEAAPAPRGAYINRSYDAYGGALDLALWLGRGPNFARDIGPT